MNAPGDVAGLLAALPIGTSTGTAHGKRFVASRTVFNAGRSTKLVAEQLGGPDHTSMNYYDLARGARLYPCEMPADKVIAFLRSYVPDDSPTR